MRDRIRGCLLAGAIGDALGAPVEFWSLAEIRAQLGPAGVTGYVGNEALITDDTQMTLCTAEGLIRASIRGRSKGICHPPSVIHHGYLRWLHTQGVPWEQARGSFDAGEPDGWLVMDARLHRRRAPGNTCLSALHSGEAGSVAHPLNDSKGCGGVMRVAPVGLLVDDPEEAFELGCEAAAVTHGHASGWLPAGFLAAVVALLTGGVGLPAAVERARRLLLRREGHDETARAVDSALALAESGVPTPEQIESLGGAWVGEEAWAIAVCCALSAPDLPSGVLAAVSHSGDSDSTGAICGNILGAARGVDAIPPEWIAPLDVDDIVLRVADDLWTEHYQPPGREGDVPTEWWERYPGW